MLMQTKACVAACPRLGSEHEHSADAWARRAHTRSRLNVGLQLRAFAPGRRGCCHPRPPQIRTCRFPASGSSRGEVRCHAVAMEDHGSGKRMARQESVEACPCEPLRTRPPLQPLPPQLDDLLAIPVHLPNIARDAVIDKLS